MLRRKEYLSLFETKTHVDPYTGKDKRVAVYIGPWYAFSASKRERRRLSGTSLALWGLSAALMVACGLTNAEGGRTFYTLPFYLFAFFPLFYLGMGLAKVFRCADRFTEVTKDEGVDRVRVSAMGMAALAGLHTVGEIVLMLLGGAGDALWREVWYGAGIALAGVCALLILRLRGRLVFDKEEPNVAK